jgi:hypothetical protein
MKKFLCNVLMIVCIFSGMNVMEGFGQACAPCTIIEAFEASCDPANASGDCSVAIGSNADASEFNSIAVGAASEASGSQSMSFGVSAEAAGIGSTAIHTHASALGDYSLAVGGTAMSIGAASYTFGSMIAATESSSFAFGKWVSSDAEEAFIMGLGTTITGFPLFSNDIERSMMFGMNSDVPTLFIGESGGTGTWGNIGIGNITAPASLLHVRDQMRVGLTGSADGSLLFNNTAGSTITFNTPTSLTTHSYTWPTAQATTSGQVLVNDGTGTLSWAAPGSASGSWLVDGNSGTNPSSNFLGTIDSVDLVLRTDNTERMRVRANGRVGIGTGGPAARLHVSGPVGTNAVARFNTAGANGNQFLQIGNNSQTSAFSGYILGRSDQQANPSLRLWAETDPSSDAGDTPVMLLQVGRIGLNEITDRPLFALRESNVSAPVMQVDANGNLGIGTTTPSGRLHVNGTVFINPANVPPSTVIGGGTGEEDLGIDATSGQLINLSTSSIHFKDNVENMEFDREAFLQLRPVNFRWKEYYGGHQDVGLIAQEVAETFPALASWSHKYTHLDNGELLLDTAGTPVVDTTQLEVSGVRYHKLPVYLLALVQGQQQELNELRQQVQQLTEQVSGCCADISGPMHRLDGSDQGSPERLNDLTEFILLRNDPNPFSDYTDIKYEHSGCGRCEVIISDMSGRIVKRIKTEGSSGTARVYSSEISAGLFVYSLVVDGQVVRTERMVSSNR